MMPKTAATTAELAEILHVTTRTVDRLVSGRVIPRPVGGRHDVMAAAKAYLGHIRHDADGRGARAEQARATAVRQRIQARQALGTLLTIDEMGTVFATLAGQYWKAAQQASSLTYHDIVGQIPGLDESKYRTIAFVFDAHLNDWTRAARDATLDALDKLPAALRDDQRIDDLLRQLEDADVTPAPKRRRKAKP